MYNNNAPWDGASLIESGSQQYQWEDCDSAGLNCTAIPGATGDTYTVQDSDVGHIIIFSETATDYNGVSISATSIGSYSELILPVAPVNTVLPTITSGLYESHIPEVGAMVTGNTGTWTGVPDPTYTYQWQDCPLDGHGQCTAIPGATSASYTPTNSDLGYYLEFVVTATNSGGSQESAILAGDISVGSPANTTLPTLSDNGIPVDDQTIPEVGDVLSANVGTWFSLSPITYTYQWYGCNDLRDCGAITGATDATYTIPSWDDGYQIWVQVTATNTGGSWEAYSDDTLQVGS